VAEPIDRSSAVGRRLPDWSGVPSAAADKFPARLCPAFHFLPPRGNAPALAALYPPADRPEADALWTAVMPLLEERGAVFDDFLENPPQTNEVGRSAMLMSGLLVVADAFPLPLRLFELGSSAGLNLVLDRYGYDLGGREAGDPQSALLLAPDWAGPPPPSATIDIVERRGVDLSPRDVTRDGERLLAFVWADQRERIARLEAALAIAAADPPPVDLGDAAEWLERLLPAAPAAGAVRVVLHSIAFQYFPATTQARIAQLLERLGTEADERSPLAWLRCEQLPGEERASLRLRTWPGGERLLGWAQAHGAAVEWLG